MVKNEHVDVSIILPLCCEGEAIRVTLPLVKKAIVEIGLSTELIIVVTPTNEKTLDVITEMADHKAIRHIKVDTNPGKFRAILEGVKIARGAFLVLIDGDVAPETFALKNLLGPLIRGDTDVSVSRPIAEINMSGGLLKRFLWKWGDISMEVWHLVRESHPELLWALPGHLYALRRHFFPKSPLIPILDDASVGIHARDSGAKFKYVENAFVRVLLPTNYSDWCRQKVRVRKGWEALDKIKGEDVCRLKQAIKDTKWVIKKRHGLVASLLFLHDSLLRYIARNTLRVNREYFSETWKPIMSSKLWAKLSENVGLCPTGSVERSKVTLFPSIYLILTKDGGLK